MKCLVFNKNHSGIWRPFHGGYAYGSVEFPIPDEYAFESSEEAERCIAEVGHPGDGLNVVTIDKLIKHMKDSRKVA